MKLLRLHGFWFSILALGLALTSAARAQTNSDVAHAAAREPSAATPPTPTQPAPTQPAPTQPGAEAAPPAQPLPPPPAREWLKAVYEQVVDSVVLIETEYGTGSGFFFQTPTLIATALHVVDDADTIVVQTSDGRRQLGHVVAYSRKHDLALVRLEHAAPGARVLEPANGPVEIGQPVIVIGHPFSGLEYQVRELRGLLNWSMTQGVVSAVAGSWLQTDAAINPGNSGGPVVNERGEVLGVVSATLSQAQGISVAARVVRLRELLPLIDSQPPPRHLWRFEAMELGFVVQGASDVIEGFSLGAGMRLLKHVPVRMRLSVLAGNVQPRESNVLTTRLIRGAAELSGGYALSLGVFELSPNAGAALFYDHERNSSLRVDGNGECVAMMPCLVNGKVISASEGRFRLLPMVGVSLDFARLRLDYAYQIAIQQSIDSQHRVLVAFTF
ncbi:MAG TPA: S1C family serine protease [Polyangiaceae bacterium]|nr:S1C family serine protease [Polyangiaceae bacterium]